MKRKPLLPHIQAWVDRKGRTYHYFRKRGCLRQKLAGAPFSPEFMAAYQAAMATVQPTIGVRRSPPGSVSAAIVAYHPSQSFRAMAPSSQVIRRQILEHFREKHGDKRIAFMPSKFIGVMLDQMHPSPRAIG